MSSISDKRISILISGRGSNMEAFLKAQRRGALTGQVVRVTLPSVDAYDIERPETIRIVVPSLS